MCLALKGRSLSAMGAVYRTKIIKFSQVLKGLNLNATKLGYAVKNYIYPKICTP